MGSIIIDNATPPARGEKPTAFDSIRTRYVQTPAIIEGNPERTFAIVRTILPTRRGTSSIAKMADNIPTGPAISTAIPTEMTDPTSALNIPPSEEPGAGVFLRKKPGLRAGNPLTNTSLKMLSKGIQAITVKTAKVM
jgi:hypothetical protein